MILFANACVRRESRTKRLADVLLSKMAGEIDEVRISDIAFPTANEDFLRKRDTLIAANKWDDPLFKYARQFAKADQIVIAAPYWDLSFPAALKQYFEQINVLGITFEYSPDGMPISKCRADSLYYVMTAGGAFVPEDYGFGYVKSLAQGFYGIKDVKLLKAVGLDIYGADTEGIMKEAIESIDAFLNTVDRKKLRN